MDGITTRLPLRYHAGARTARQSGFKAEIFLVRHQLVHLPEHKLSSLNGLSLRGKRRQASSNKVSVDKLDNVGRSRNKASGKGGFPRAVRPGDDVNVLSGRGGCNGSHKACVALRFWQVKLQIRGDIRLCDDFSKIVLSFL